MKTRCCRLDAQGSRCRIREGVKLVIYHGDGEIYGYDEDAVTWVAVPICKKHRHANGGMSTYSERQFRREAPQDGQEGKKP